MISFVLTPNRWAVVLLLLGSFHTLFAQISDRKLDSLCLDPISFNMPEQQLGKEDFIYTPHFAFKLVGDREEYAVVQLGRQRKAVPFMYFKLSPTNACVTPEKIVHIKTQTGTILSLKNKLKSNCDGLVVVEIDGKDLEVLSDETISSIIIDTFDQKYKMDLPQYDAERIRYDIYCLNYKDF